ncbi:MAG: AarF/UbiB family protein [Lentilactobacillus buchneri]|nr:AarF/UbiB family protein [Lentilactobacillus buchneri]MCI2019401.1 AarF/UbiB family protein [Lentilactobacillus buchneri]MCI2028027.1 AarF/UbiB family protein [Lentilactobacillus buchneri]
MTKISVNLDDPLFFVSSEESFNNSKKYSLPLPDGWDEMRDRTEWVNIFPVKTAIERQGWKVHISSDLQNSLRVLQATAKVCFQEGVTFKHLGTVKDFMVRNGKLMDRAYAGKFITCYPDRSELKHFLTILENALKGFNGPYILSDKKWANSPIYLRYGVFRATASGEKFPKNNEKLGINGRAIFDQRVPRFIIPDGLELPEFISKWSEQREDKIQNDDMPFLVHSAIRFSNSGGLYNATLKSNGVNVILKEARPFAGLDNNYKYAPDRLATENQVLESLTNFPSIPKAYWFGKVWEHTFLAIEKMPGIQLNRWVTKNYPIYSNKSDNYLNRIYLIMRKLVTLLNKVHNKRIFHQDIHLGNIIIDEKDNISLIDWEEAVVNETTKREHAVAASGFRAWGSTTPEQIDWYGLYRVGCYLLYPLADQADLVYGYSKQTLRAGESLFKKMHYHYKDLKKYLQLLSMIGQKIPQVAVTSPNKILRPYLEDDANYEKDDSIESLGKHLIIGSLETLNNWRYYKRDRFFPVHYYGIKNNKGIAFSDLSIVWSTDKLLHSLGINASPEASIDTLTDKEGLFDGDSGSLWMLNELGETEFSVNLFNRDFKNLVKRSSNNNLYSGVAGILLVGLDFNEQNLLKPKTQEMFEDVLKAFVSDYKRDGNKNTFDQVSLTETNDPQRQDSGLFYGDAGVGLLFSQAFRKFNDPIFQEALNLSIRKELSRYTTDKFGSLQYLQGNRLLPYLSMGSAGLAYLIASNADLINSEYLSKLDKLHNAIKSNYCVFPGLFQGFSGIKLSDYLITKKVNPERLSLIRQSMLSGLKKYLIRIGNGVCVAGDSGSKITMDVATGYAGIALTISSILDEKIDFLPTL